jgi:fluoride ion exporter CrcB/FEX
MIRLTAIAAGGAIGALLRFWVSSSMYALLGRDFPYGTLIVNIWGCFLMGFLSIFMYTRSQTLFGNAFLDALRRTFIQFPLCGDHGCSDTTKRNAERNLGFAILTDSMLECYFVSIP